MLYEVITHDWSEFFYRVAKSYTNKLIDAVSDKAYKRGAASVFLKDLVACSIRPHFS